MIGALLTALGNLIIFTVIALLIIVGIFFFLMRRVMSRGSGQAPRRGGYGDPQPGVVVVDSTVVDEDPHAASSAQRAADMPDSAEVQIIEVTTRND